MNFGGPHAGFMAIKKAYVKQMPGRLIGISRDVNGNLAYRLSLQTREQFIRKDRATSNICTAQALLANMSAMYVLYHGPDGIHSIGHRCNKYAMTLATAAQQCGHELLLPQDSQFFDTIKFRTKSDADFEALRQRAIAKKINLRYFGNNEVGVSCDETMIDEDVQDLIEVFGAGAGQNIAEIHEKTPKDLSLLDSPLNRESKYLQQKRFSAYRSELSITRYMKHLENKDYSLTHGMIPLGSCTMKLTATAELMVCLFT